MHQRFKIKNNTLKSVNSDLVVDIEGGEQQGHRIIQWQKNGGPNQNWTFHRDGSIRSPKGLCLDIRDGNIRQGAEIIAWPPNGGLNQKWRLVNVWD